MCSNVIGNGDCLPQDSQTIALASINNQSNKQTNKQTNKQINKQIYRLEA
jgi:hypothetical protein